MRQFAITLLALTMLPTATLWSQPQTVPVVDGSIPAELADADVVTAAELETTLIELETAHAQNYNTLATIIDKVPAEARPAIEQALENSKRGYLQAKSNRERTTSMRQTKANARLAKSHGQAGRPANFGPMNGPQGQAGQNGQLGRGFAGSPQGQGQGQPQFQGQPQGPGQSQSQPTARTAQLDQFGRPVGGSPSQGAPNLSGQNSGAPNAGSQAGQPAAGQPIGGQPNGGQGRGQVRR